MVKKFDGNKPKLRNDITIVPSNNMDQAKANNRAPGARFNTLWIAHSVSTSTTKIPTSDITISACCTDITRTADPVVANQLDEDDHLKREFVRDVLAAVDDGVGAFGELIVEEVEPVLRGGVGGGFHARI